MRTHQVLHVVAVEALADGFASFAEAPFESAVGIAAAFDVPCVSVMGPNSPQLTATSLEWCEVVRRDDLACSPCLERVCPLEHHRCLRELPVTAVTDAADRLLARAAERDA